jgi:hypothetical protein
LKGNVRKFRKKTLKRKWKSEKVQERRKKGGENEEKCGEKGRNVEDEI